MEKKLMIISVMVALLILTSNSFGGGFGEDNVGTLMEVKTSSLVYSPDILFEALSILALSGQQAFSKYVDEQIEKKMVIWLLDYTWTQSKVVIMGKDVMGFTLIKNLKDGKMWYIHPENLK